MIQLMNINKLYLSLRAHRVAFRELLVALDCNGWALVRFFYRGAWGTVALASPRIAS